MRKCALFTGPRNVPGTSQHVRELQLCFGSELQKMQPRGPLPVRTCSDTLHEA